MVSMTFEVDRTCKGASRRRDGGPLTITVKDLDALLRLVAEHDSVCILPPAEGSELFRLELGSSW
jgi:hypothetical protein